MAIDHGMVLRTATRGRTIFPGDEDYDAERTGWNLTVDHHPAAIVLAEEAGDVAEAVRFAAEADLPVAVQSTGHGASVPADGAVYINTRKLTGLSVAPEHKTARIEAGLRWGQVLQATGEHGLAALSGSSDHVGVMGYLTGGGLPVVARTFGFAANTVRSMDVVTADGRLRTVSPQSEPDLFWAIRGGKSNFGIVVAAELDLLALPGIYGGSLSFGGANAERVLRGYLAWTRDQPEEMTSSIILVRFPDIPQMADAVRGRSFANIRIAYAGDSAAGSELVAPLRALHPEKDEVGELPYHRIGEIYHDPFRPTPAYCRTGLLRELDDSAVDQLIDVVGPGRNVPFGGVELRHLGGALHRPMRRDAAVDTRGAAFHLFTSMPAPLATNEVDQVNATQAELLRALAPWHTGMLLPGFMFTLDTEPGDIRRAYSDAAFQRLVAVKSAYDPQNLFRVNHNIPPR